MSIVPATNRQFIQRLDELVDIHVSAMGYPATTTAQRRALWLHNGSYPDFTCSIALIHRLDATPDLADPRQRAVGVAFAFRGSPETWWYQQVARGLAEAGHSRLEISRILHAYAELSEIHVSPHAQGRGLGRLLLEDLLHRIPQRTVMLSTPEDPQESNGAWRLYRSAGFQNILRNFYFPPDPRPFAILSLTLD